MYIILVSAVMLAKGEERRREREREREGGKEREKEGEGGREREKGEIDCLRGAIGIRSTA